MERFALVENTESYKRWERKYYFGRKYKEKMSVRRRGKYKKKYTNSKYRRRGSNLGLRVKRLERGIAGKEFKFHDQNDATSPTVVPTIICLNELAEGVTSSTRNGLNINLGSIYMKMMINSNPAAAADQDIRIIIFIDREQDGDYPGYEDVIEARTYIMSQKQHLQNKSRFKFLYDKVTVLNGVIAGQQMARYKEYYKRFKNPIRISYIGGSSAEASMGKNSVFMMLISNTAEDDPQVVWNCRLRFTG